MKIGLYNLEPKIVNTAMMQVSTYHKQLGDQVEIYSPLYHNEYDKIYAFSLFDFTDKGYVTSDMVTGGTGFDITSRLPRRLKIAIMTGLCILIVILALFGLVGDVFVTVLFVL